MGFTAGPAGYVMHTGWSWSFNNINSRVSYRYTIYGINK